MPLPLENQVPRSTSKKCVWDPTLHGRRSVFLTVIFIVFLFELQFIAPAARSILRYHILFALNFKTCHIEKLLLPILFPIPNWIMHSYEFCAIWCMFSP